MNHVVLNLTGLSSSRKLLVHSYESVEFYFLESTWNSSIMQKPEVLSLGCNSVSASVVRKLNAKTC